MNSSILRVQVFSDTWKETINIIIDQNQCKNRKDTKRCKKKNIGKNSLWGIKADRCAILCVKPVFKHHTAAASALFLHFVTLNSLWWVNTSWRGEGGHEDGRMQSPHWAQTPSRVLDLYFIQYCQLTPAAPDHHNSSSLALHSTDATALQVNLLKNRVDLTLVTHWSVGRGQQNENPDDMLIMLLCFSLWTRAVGTFTLVKVPFIS